MPTSRTIIIVTDQGNMSGGAPKVALRSAVELGRRGHDVHVFMAAGPIDESLLTTPGVSVHCLQQYEILTDPNRLRAMTSGLWNFRAYSELLKLIKSLESKDPIVHFHTWMKALSPSVISAGLKSGATCLYTLHDYFTACPQGGFLDHSTAQVCHRRPLSFSCINCRCDARSHAHKIWRVAREMIQLGVVRYPARCREFLTVSPFAASRIRPYLPEESRIDVIRCPIDVEKMQPADVENNQGFVFVGRLSREKGAVHFAEAAARLGVTATFIGSGEEDVKVRAANPQAEISGWLPSNEVFTRIRQARAVVFPSLWNETQGLVAIEAAALGVPVIYSNVTAIEQDFTHGRQGLSFAAGNVDDLTEQLRRLVDPSEARRMGREAYDWYWSDPWTMQRHVEQLETVYDRLSNH